MENPSAQVNSLVEYISQLVSLNRRLQKKKVDIQTSKLAFVQLDTKRKGYLDLTNIFELTGNVSQDELFHVFKWLDVSKKGDISPEDFEYVLVNNQTQKNQDRSSPLESLKDVVTVYLENLQYSENLKTKLNLNGLMLMAIFKSICQSQRLTFLRVQDLIYVFSHAPNWDSWCEQEIKTMFKDYKSITQKLFLEKFAPLKEIEPNQTKKSDRIIQNVSVHEEQLLDDIDNQYVNTKNDSKYNNRAQQHKAQVQQKNYNLRQNLQVTNNFKNPVQVPQFMQRSEIHSYKISPQKEITQIQTMLSNIQKRRNELRRGSLQRKKLIQQALSRKKSTLTLDWQSPSQPTLLKAASHSKLDTYSQLLNTPNYSLKQKDFGQMFSKYRQDKEISKFAQPRKPCGYSNMEESQVQIENLENRFYATHSFQRKPQKIDPRSEVRNLNLDLNNNQQRDYRNVPLTPKFSQTFQQKLYQRPSSALKADRYAELKQKITNMPERYQQNKLENNSRQIQQIVEKYRRNNRFQSPKASDNHPQRTRFQKQNADNTVYSYLRNKDSNIIVRQSNQKFFSQKMQLRGDIYDQKLQRRPTPDNMQSKYRLNGCISQNVDSSLIQKQNLLKRAQQQATRKIQQIERKARMKVLQRKTTVGLKWVK